MTTLHSIKEQSDDDGGEVVKEVRSRKGDGYKATLKEKTDHLFSDGATVYFSIVYNIAIPTRVRNVKTDSQYQTRVDRDAEPAPGRVPDWFPELVAQSFEDARYDPEAHAALIAARERRNLPSDN